MLGPFLVRNGVPCPGDMRRDYRKIGLAVTGAQFTGNLPIWRYQSDAKTPRPAQTHLAGLMIR
ncbi:hypothetical protein Pla52n_15900 [Stieleria varia]|uniref:Uncharacterized protein n=1 Tax=Stieleria varia TaxID=2528005 RepID=A0A5C6B0P3_9BACT|nr:hypothetical protein Pla52n_15900 [Stieleria varia]